mmetsp:Transcript_29332/g.75616  ORF Transcript_29332/g.75616 Transcript_29332/m.75616 type:complete len:209 (-) Transcript_29332:118-744(-)
MAAAAVANAAACAVCAASAAGSSVRMAAAAAIASGVSSDAAAGDRWAPVARACAMCCWMSQASGGGGGAFTPALTSAAAAAVAIACDIAIAAAGLSTIGRPRMDAPSGMEVGCCGSSAGTRRLSAGISAMLDIGAGSSVGLGSRSFSASSASTNSIVQYVEGFDSVARSREPAASSMALSQPICVLRACFRTPSVEAYRLLQPGKPHR